MKRGWRWTEHALRRLEERGITALDVLEALMAGQVRRCLSRGRLVEEWRLRRLAVIVDAVSGTVITVFYTRTTRAFFKTKKREARQGRAKMRALGERAGASRKGRLARQKLREKDNGKVSQNFTAHLE